MKYQCAVIFAFFVSINLVTSAPLFDFEPFFNELLEINTRVADLINRTKSAYYTMRGNSIGPIGVVDTTKLEDHYQPDEIAVEADVNEINPVEQTNVQPSENINNKDEKKIIPNESDADIDNDTKHIGEGNIAIKSYKDYAVGALDAIETKWNDWFGQKKDDVDVDNLQDKAVDSGDANVNNGAAEIIQTQSNDQQIEISTPQPIADTESDNHVDVVDVNKEPLIPDNADLNEEFGEETYNNEDEFDEEPGWFENAIDSIVGFFN